MTAQAVLVIHARADVADDWLASHLDAARTAYPSMDVVPLRGPSGDASAFTGRDVVIWPWLALQSSVDALRPFAAVVARTAKRVRLVAPTEKEDRIGPADLNGHEPIEWARSRCVDVEASVAGDLEAEWFGGDEPAPVELLEETHEYVSHWVPSDAHPDMIEEEQPEPVDLFAKPAIPALERGMLPQSLAAFVFDQSEIIGSDPCILAVSTLVACAAVTSDAYRLQPKEFEFGWKESARLWGAFVGDPSVKKTPPLNRATAHLRKIDADFAEKGEEAMHRYKIARKVYEAQEKRYIDASAKNQPVGPLPDPPERPPQRRVIVQDATIEAIADVLADNHEGVLVLFDELSGFFGSMDAYRAQGGKDRSFWLESYNGGPRRVDRISREARNVPNLSTCILGGIQPNAIREKAKDLVEDGLLQRFMIVIASGGHSLGEDRRADTEATALYRGILDTLVRAVDADPEKPLTFAADARAVLQRVEVRLDELTRADRLPTRMRYQIGKWSGLFVRLCLTYHAIECAAVGFQIAGQVAADIAERVESFMFGFLIWHLQYFYEVVLGDSTGEVELLHRVARWLLASTPDTFAHHNISKGVKAWAGSPWNTRRNVMERLENCGWVVTIKTRNPRQNQTWSFNKAAAEKFSQIADAEKKRREEGRARIVGNVDGRPSYLNRE